MKKPVGPPAFLNPERKIESLWVPRETANKRGSPLRSEARTIARAASREPVSESPSSLLWRLYHASLRGDRRRQAHARVEPGKRGSDRARPQRTASDCRVGTPTGRARPRSDRGRIDPRLRAHARRE